MTQQQPEPTYRTVDQYGFSEGLDDHGEVVLTMTLVTSGESVGYRFKPNELINLADNLFTFLRPFTPEGQADPEDPDDYGSLA
jgi:hypothetical protein